ncbi:MAG: hypothetical protein KY391_07600 [Actinobacteria bacterium]|nr:hypothetical protein [Actinomycetota bacterium]
MRYLPMLAATAGLLILVIFMAGPGERRTEVARNMAITLGVLVVLVFLFGLVARQWVRP